MGSKWELKNKVGHFADNHYKKKQYFCLNFYESVVHE